MVIPHISPFLQDSPLQYVAFLVSPSVNVTMPKTISTIILQNFRAKLSAAAWTKMIIPTMLVVNTVLNPS